MEKIAEFRTPLAPHFECFIDEVSRIDGFDSIILADGGGIDKIVLAEKIRDRRKNPLYLKVCCSNKNRTGIYSELLTAASLGFSHLVLADGPHPLSTEFPSAKPVYDFDAYSLLRILKQDFPSLSKNAPPLRAVAPWKIGICIGGATKPDLVRAEQSLALGADSIFTHSEEAVGKLKQLTQRQVILSVLKTEIHDLTSAVRKAEAAGADGVRVIFGEVGGKC